MPPQSTSTGRGRGQGRPLGRPRGGRGGQGAQTPEPQDDPDFNPLQPGASPDTPGANLQDLIGNLYVPGTSLEDLVGNAAAPGFNPLQPGAPVAPLNQTAASTRPVISSRITPREGEDPATFERRASARQKASEYQARRRAQLRAIKEAEEGNGSAEPKRKLPRAALIQRLNECSARVTRSQVERDEELINCERCIRGHTWLRKCHGGDECIECEARDLTCVRANKRHFDEIREKQLAGMEAWRPDVDQCRQCKSRGSQCWMPGNMVPGTCYQCEEDDLECDITPLPARRCKICHWEHKCTECARNHMRCDGQIPCFVCQRKKIPCEGLKPDGSCPDIPISVYGTGLPPAPVRNAVLPTHDARNWPPPSGRLEIAENRPTGPFFQAANSAPGGPQDIFGAGPVAGPPVGLFAAPGGPYISPYEQDAGPSSGPVAGPSSSPPGYDPPGVLPGSSSPVDPQLDPPPAGIDLSNFPNSLYSPFDDVKPPCSWCRVDPGNRVCDDGTPCRECSKRGIIQTEECRTSRPCETCFMNEIPCDIASPCQNCLFLGFTADECRAEGLSEQRYFPDDDPDEDEPYIDLPGQVAVPEYNYSCAFCIAYGYDGCDPRDRPCLPCMQHQRTALQCRFEERCARCIELDVPCDGNFPCSLCATADGLTSMMCLGRGDRTMPGGNNNDNDEPLEGDDIPMGEGGDYPAFDGFGDGLFPQVANNPFAPAEPPEGYVDPNALVVPQQGGILPQNQVPLVPPGGFFTPPEHVRSDFLRHYRIRSDVLNNGYFNPVPGAHVNWSDWADEFRCEVTLANGQPCGNLPTIYCDGDTEHGDKGMCVCERCRNLADEQAALLMEEIEAKKNLFCCATCSQAQMIKFNNGTGFENMETLVDYHCECDTQMRSWLCYPCKYKVIHAVGNRMITTREALTRDTDGAILCPRCGVEPGNKEAAYHLAKGVARCSSCWWWINYAT
ncbi:hypothetical protein O988_05433 [Pseudogymnoascus sp. VKM F-3808]|nr:hypothetical protein O988_05433 [Pseudogymnoascus sp. VKM F-3808]